MKENLPQVFVPSRLFIYYNERVIENTVDSDSGAMIRDGIKTMAKQGACPEPMWPYQIEKFRIKPSATCYTEAAKHTAASYQRLIQSLSQMQGCLASGYPFVFGFTVYESFESSVAARTGHAAMPGPASAFWAGTRFVPSVTRTTSAGLFAGIAGGRAGVCAAISPHLLTTLQTPTWRRIFGR
jgi:C1A family cysteine protease